jgi:hypothetical protein
MSEDGIEMNDLKGKRQSVSKWLLLAVQMDELTPIGELLLKPIPVELLNCRDLIGWLQRAFVLSFYFLLRHKAYQ